jgi:uncharacterized membrane protein YvlD (DUF360 family)
MKKILKTFIIITISLKITEIVLGNIYFETPWQTLLVAAAGLTLFELFLKPIAKILLLPINLITLGALRWVVNVLGLFIVTTFVDGFRLSQYNFPGVNWNGINLPAHTFNLLFSYIIVALLFNLIVSILGNILK